MSTTPSSPTVPPVERRGRHLVARAEAGCDPDLLDALVHDPDALLDGAEMLKDGDRSTVVRLVDRNLVVKRYNRTGIVHTVTHAPLPSRAARCWRHGVWLRAAGVQTPAPLAYAERRRGGVCLESYLVTAYVAGRVLSDLRVDWRPAATELDRLTAAIAALWRRLGALHVVHDDLKADNFVWSADEHLWLLDLDGLRRTLRGPFYQRARREDRRSFMDSWKAHPEYAGRFEGALG